MGPAVVTERLALRPWEERDREPFNALCNDPEAMRFLSPRAKREESDAWIDRQIAHQAEHGFCFWAAELRDTGAFAGSIGLVHVPYEAHFTPAIEIGWRLVRTLWGQGLATEGARGSLRFGFGALELAEIVANTSANNHASQRVMERLGMTRDAADDFDHPRLAEGNPLRPQVLYRLRRAD